jgi:hypothetical protein
MHHAPQNIPNVKHKPSALVTALANSPDVVDASKATDADLRTKVVSYSGPGPASKLANNDPIPPQTFWCEVLYRPTYRIAGEPFPCLVPDLTQVFPAAARCTRALRRTWSPGATQRSFPSFPRRLSSHV